MARVGGIAGGGPVAGRPGSRRVGGFAVPAGGTEEAGGPSRVQGPGLVGVGLLALQEGGERDAAARRRADSALEELRGLQLELLGGTLDPGRLDRLAALQQGEAAADPALEEAVSAVLLRAQVELAKRQRTVSASAA